jgi:hypothetical protein
MQLSICIIKHFSKTGQILTDKDYFIQEPYR